MNLTWALTPSGFHAQVTKTRLARELGSSYVYRGRATKLVTVVIRDGHVTVHVTKSVQAARIAPAGQFPGHKRRSERGRAAVAIMWAAGLLTGQVKDSCERNQGDASGRRIAAGHRWCR